MSEEPERPVDYSPERAQRILDDGVQLSTSGITGDVLLAWGWGRCLSLEEIHVLNANIDIVPIQRTTLDNLFG